MKMLENRFWVTPSRTLGNGFYFLIEFDVRLFICFDFAFILVSFPLSVTLLCSPVLCSALN